MIRTTVGLGTFISIEVTASQVGKDPREILDLACAVFADVDRGQHPVRDGSDLAAIRRSGRGELVRVGAATFRTLALAREFWEASGGSFDPCAPDGPGRFGDVELVTPDGVRCRGPTVALDLGGIAKGCAIDSAIETMRAAGATSGLVNAGGDLRVFGEPRVIRVDVGATPRDLEIADAALAVSAPKSQRSPSEHRGFYSPHTGEPVAGRAVAIRAPTAGVADALTKCVIVCAPDDARALLDRYGATLLELT